MESDKETSSQEKAKGESTAAWDFDWVKAVCEKCNWAYLIESSLNPLRCPHCQQTNLAILNNDGVFIPSTHPPERVVPFSLSTAESESAIHRFASGIPFAPADLNSSKIQSRSRRLYLPVWLVDSRVRARWKAEAGFNYQVVSHEEKYEQNHGSWATREVEETRTRWEPRLGNLDREYYNIEAPALENQSRVWEHLGDFDQLKALQFEPDVIRGAVVRLPDRMPEDSWSDAEPTLKSAAGEECRLASGADHIRGFSWQPDFSNQNWTLLLLPVISSFYLDDAGKAQSVLMNGQDGATFGVRRASLKRAQRMSLVLSILAAILFIIGLVIAAATVVFPPGLTLGALAVLFAFLLGIGAIIPLAIVWWFNRNQSA